MHSSPIQTEAMYQTLIESLPQGLVIFQDNHIVFANAAEAQLTGYSIEELVAMTPQQILDIVHSDDREWVGWQLQDWTDGKPQPSPIEIRLLRKDGPVRWIEIYATPLEYQDKSASQLVMLDLTERKQREAALVEAEALRQESELKELRDRFISLVAHLFRTPMSVINTTSYLLENYYDRLEADKRKDYFGKIRSQIDRLDELIENILTISQKEEKGLPFTPTTVNLEVFCRDLVAEIQMTTEPLHKIIFSHSGDLSSASVDEKALHHILTNLLSNAIKYSPDGGNVIFDLARQDGEALFEIRDSGIGILPDDQRHLFEPFHRGTNVTGIKGNGLGLKIVKDFVDLHGGAITCISEPDKGTTFIVRLPISQPVVSMTGQPAGDAT